MIQHADLDLQSLLQTRRDRGRGWFYLTTAHDVLRTGIDATKYRKAV